MLSEHSARGSPILCLRALNYFRTEHERDDMSDLFAADIKHAYHTIPLHEYDRHFFAFTISGIGQLQPIRMQQGSQSAGFTMTEAAYRAFGVLTAPLNEPSLLHSSDPSILPPLTFYTNDFFGGFSSFRDQYLILEETATRKHIKY